ncbi:hypothetical protein HK405_001960, partial [Cladochytrium tenue]
ADVDVDPNPNEIKAVKYVTKDELQHIFDTAAPTMHSAVGPSAHGVTGTSDGSVSLTGRRSEGGSRSSMAARLSVASLNRVSALSPVGAAGASIGGSTNSLASSLASLTGAPVVDERREKNILDLCQ